MPITQTRRRFLTTLSLAGAAGLLRAPPSLAADRSVETTNVRLHKYANICGAPELIAEGLLRAEGFTDIRYIDMTSSAEIGQALASGKVDFSLYYVSSLVAGIDGGDAITVLAGVHAGCLVLFGNEGIRNVTDLKGKKVGVPGLGSSAQLFVSVMAGLVGLDPVRDIHWVASQFPGPIELFAEGKVDAILAGPPAAQDLRARHIGHVVVNTTVDRPWSQYFCCMLAGNPEFVQKHPVATKRVLRAILKATDLCATDPARAARSLVEGGYTSRDDYAFQALSELPYDKWQEYSPEDTVRFYALRLHEVGMIKSSPQKIIAENTDWRFLDELKRELKV
jgi:NitT/TauT family transport system substrate-binding protein